MATDDGNCMRSNGFILSQPAGVHAFVKKKSLAALHEHEADVRTGAAELKACGCTGFIPKGNP